MGRIERKSRNYLKISSKDGQLLIKEKGKDWEVISDGFEAGVKSVELVYSPANSQYKIQDKYTYRIIFSEMIDNEEVETQLDLNEKVSTTREFLNSLGGNSNLSNGCLVFFRVYKDKKGRTRLFMTNSYNSNEHLGQYFPWDDETNYFKNLPRPEPTGRYNDEGVEEYDWSNNMLAFRKMFTDHLYPKITGRSWMPQKNGTRTNNYLSSAAKKLQAFKNIKSIEARWGAVAKGITLYVIHPEDQDSLMAVWQRKYEELGGGRYLNINGTITSEKQTVIIDDPVNDSKSISNLPIDEEPEEFDDLPF